MPPLQVRDLPQDLYEEFKRITEFEHRSLAQQTIVALEYFLENHEVRNGKVVETEHAPISPASFMAFEHDGITYMTDPNETFEQRKTRLDALFDRIGRLPTVELPPGFPSTAEIIREERDARTGRILHAAEEGPWR